MAQRGYAVFAISLTALVRVCSAAGDIATQKCNEYASAVYSDELSPTLMAKPSTNSVSKCGIVEVPLIVGGTQAQAKEFPHLVVIGYGNTPNLIQGWHCGGSLISPNFVLTAAHCQESGSGGPAQKVKGGIIFIDDTQNSVERIISQKIIHPQYVAGSKYNDIALFKLVTPITFTPHIRPACIDTQSVIRESKYIAAGFGKLTYDDYDGSKHLMKVQLSAIPTSECQGFYKSEQEMGILPSGIAESQICAGELHGGKDTCQGDSGGPLQTVMSQPYCMYKIIGVVSTGKFCGFANSPALYTRVSHFVPWIEQVVWG